MVFIHTIRLILNDTSATPQHRMTCTCTHSRDVTLVWSFSQVKNILHEDQKWRFNQAFKECAKGVFFKPTYQLQRKQQLTFLKCENCININATLALVLFGIFSITDKRHFWSDADKSFKVLKNLNSYLNYNCKNDLKHLLKGSKSLKTEI